MGQDKALLLHHTHVPIIQYLCQICVQFTPSVYVVTAWPERYINLVQPPCRLIPEGLPDRTLDPQGPLVGFAQGLKQVATPWVLLLACDLPYLTAIQLHDWIDKLPQVPKAATALLPRHSKGWEPLCGFYHQTCAKSLEQFIAEGGRSFQRWLEREIVQELVVSNRQVLFNCNTPHDWSFYQSGGISEA
jgi:molybdenum cofactor guanylyltransferase